VTVRDGGRDVQFKAQLLGTTPEDANEIEFVAESRNENQ
jgi:hypothetical protein